MRAQKLTLIALVAVGAALLLAASFLLSRRTGSGQAPAASPGADERTVEGPAQMTLDPDATEPGQDESRAIAPDGGASSSAPALRGKVVLSDGTPAGAGLWVLAHETGRPPEPTEVRAAMEGRGNLRLARTGERGGFSLGAVAADRAYTCLAGGSGLMSPRPERNVRAGASETVLTVQRTFGAIIELQDEQGAKPRISPALGAELAASVWSEVARAQPAGGNPLAAVLAGVEPAQLVPDPARIVQLFAADTQADRVGPNHLRVRVPGYEQAELAFDATFLGQGIATIALPLRATASGWGSLVVRFTGIAPDVGRAFDSFGGSGQVALRSEGAREDVFPARIPAEGELVIRDVPYGSYSAELRSRNSLFTYPAQGEPEVRIDVAGESATFAVDLSSAGALELAIAAPDGSAYAGPVIATLARELSETRRSGQPKLGDPSIYDPKRGPYLLGPIPAGTYLVLIQRPALATEDGPSDGLMTVTIAPGELARLSLTQAGGR